MNFLLFGLILTGCQLALTKKEFEDYDEDDFIPLNGERFDRFDWMLCEALDEREPGNVIASPISVKLLLAILYESATGQTAKDLQNALQLQSSRTVTRAQYSALVKTLQAPSANYSLDIGIRLYMDKRLHPKNWYKIVLAQYYGTYVKPMDFQKPEPAAEEINDWVTYATHGHIKNMITDAHSLAESSLMLISAIYFEGQWKSPFSVTNSYSGTFFSPDGQQPVKFMTQTNIFYYTESEELDAQFLRLPYKGRKFSMYVVLPRRFNGLNKTLVSIRPFILRREMWALQETSVAVTLPVFTFEFTMNLKKVLIDMGLSSIFTNLHELKALTGSLGTRANPVVSNIIQKATIEVNERGTIAAGATEARFTNKMGFPEIEFTASHPFLFFIEDETTGTVIFEGKFVYPKTKTGNLDVSDSKPVTENEPPSVTEIAPPSVPETEPVTEIAPPPVTETVPPPKFNVDVKIKDDDLDRFVNRPRQPARSVKQHKGNLDGTPWERSKSP